MDFYKRYPADYGKKTRHLSLQEHGAYALLLDWAYASELPLPESFEAVCRICSATTRDDRKVVESVLGQFWVKGAQGWTHKRVVEEIAKADVNRTNGIRGGRPGMFGARVPRETKPDGNPGDNPNPNRNETQNGTQTQTEPPTGTEPRTEPNEGHTQTLRLSDLKEQRQGGSPGGEPPPSAPAEPIPFERIVEIYNATMTRLPKVLVLNARRRRIIQAFWQTDARYRSLEFVRQYFEECEEDAFLNGTGPYGSGHATWQPDFDYLLRADVVTRVYEKAMSGGRP
ncbi:MAG: DUF1376 domain-containing protein [Nevskia sp.]|nr:DUF1376 domain-containing protein [Nevskia sp.]